MLARIILQRQDRHEHWHNRLLSSFFLMTYTVGLWFQVNIKIRPNFSTFKEVAIVDTDWEAKTKLFCMVCTIPLLWSSLQITEKQFSKELDFSEHCHLIVNARICTVPSSSHRTNDFCFINFWGYSERYIYSYTIMGSLWLCLQVTGAINERCYA